jgi:hypothetical protein
MTPSANVAQEGRKPWETLRGFTRRTAATEQCELCGEELAVEHQHLVEPASRRLVCACDACALLFDHHAQMKYRRVPRRVRQRTDFRLDDIQWEGLQIPIGLAFFFSSTAAGKVVAIYPSPAGPTESLLDLGAWDEIVRQNPVLQQMEPDTEALLVNRLGDAREYYQAPIDQCYYLIGLIRARWQGLSGGAKVWEEIRHFFDGLKQRSE